MTTTEHDYIADDLRSLAFPVANLKLLPGNPRRGDVDAVARSYERFGQRKPIVARRSDMTVIAGNHQLQAAQRLGWTHVAVVWTDDDDLTAKAFALADNRTSDLGTYDMLALNELLASVSVDESLLIDAGYSMADFDPTLDQLIADSESSDAAPSRDLLLLQDVTVAEPSVQPENGSVWRLGRHVLVVADMVRQWDLWVPYLQPGYSLVPYAGPFVALMAPEDQRLVLVQPVRYVAGHVLDKWAAVHGQPEQAA